MYIYIDVCQITHTFVYYFEAAIRQENESFYLQRRRESREEEDGWEEGERESKVPQGGEGTPVN